jgi:hypothetical protein
LQSFGKRILTRHLNTLLAPFEKAIARDEELDVQEVAYDYAMVVFGELAYDVSAKSVVVGECMLTAQRCPVRLCSNICRFHGTL